MSKAIICAYPGCEREARFRHEEHETCLEHSDALLWFRVRCHCGRAWSVAAPGAYTCPCGAYQFIVAAKERKGG